VRIWFQELSWMSRGSRDKAFVRKLGARAAPAGGPFDLVIAHITRHATIGCRQVKMDGASVKKRAGLSASIQSPAD